MKRKLLYRASLILALFGFTINTYAQCGPGQSELTLSIDFSGDAFPDEDGWRLINLTDGITVDSACFGTYASSTGIETIIICADTGKSYILKAYDDFGDGLDGSTWSIGYTYGSNIATIGTNNFNIASSLCNPNYSNNELADSTVAFMLQYVAPPACLSPSANAGPNSLTVNSAEVAWVENGSATSWRVEWDTAGYASGTARNSIVVMNDTFTTITGLTAQTSYDWAVKALCGATDSSSNSMGSFTTPCVGVSSFPYTENFDGSLTNNVWDCWTVIDADNAGGTWEQANTYITARSGTWTAHGMGNNNDHLITPQLVLPAGTNMRMKVWDIVESATRPNDYSVLVSTTGTAIADFTDTLASYSVTNTSWTERTVDLSAYTGQTIYISMWQSFSTSSFWGFGLDDFLVEAIPACLAPSANSGTILTSTSADINWIENGTATQWEVEYGSSGFTLGSGTSIIVNVDTFTTISGLMAQTSYDWYLRSICGSNDTSAWTSINSFTTACAPVVAPFFEDFESFGTISGMNGTYGCYVATRQNTSNDWNIGTSPSTGTGPSSPYSGTRYLFLEASGGSTGAEATLTSPIIDVSGLTLPMIEFYYHMFGDNRGQFGNLYIDVIDGGVTTTVDSLINEQQTSQADPWKRREITLPGVGNTIQIVIRGTRGTTSQWGDISVDDFAVIEAPTCPVPSMLTSSVIGTDSASLAWTNNSSATSFEIEYGVTGFTLGTGSTIVTSSNPDTLTGLMAATSYDWYVRAICSSTDTSIWSTSGSFVTPCAVITNFPHTESFNTTSTPNCWSETGSEAWRYSTSAGYTAGNVLDHTGNNGNYAWIDGSTPNGPNQISRLLSEFYDVSSLTTPQLEFFIYSHYAPGLPTYNTIEVEMYNGTSWDTLWVNQGSLEDRWRRVAVDLSAYTITGDIQFRFSITENGSTAFYNDILLDDITVQELAPCNTPTIDPITTVSSTSATVNWSSNGYGNDFQIEFGPAGFTLGSGVDSVIVGDTTVDITGLMSRTSYDVYVRSICGILDTSSWTAASSFTTPIAGPRTLACGTNFTGNILTEDFDNTTSFTGNINAGNGSWLYDNNNTGSGNTGPSAAHSGSHYIFFETSTGGPTTGSLVSPVIDLTSASTAAELSFWLHAYGATTGTLDVGVSTSATGPFTTLFTNTGEIQTDELDPFVNVGVNLDAYLGQSIYIEFLYTRGSSFTGDLAIDLVEVNTCLSCPTPTNPTASNATSNSVDLAWTENGAATAWEIEYGPIGFTPGTGTMVAASSNPYTLTGLSNYTTYDYVVRSRCSPTDSSSYSSATTFFTGLPMSGVYTIDSNSTAANNFISFSDLSAIINGVGVSGAVTVNVAPGTYNDQFSLGVIPGSSDTNTITIDGGSAATTTLTHDKSIRNSTINLDGTSDITIQNMTIAATGGTDSWGIHLWNSADDVTIDNNIITLNPGTTGDVAGIIASNSEISDAAAGSNANDLTISNNTITGGERGMSIYGSFTASARSQNVTITNNDIQNSDDNGIYLVGYNNVTMTDNNIVNATNNTFNDAIYISDLENFTITGNSAIGSDCGLDADDLNFDNTVTARSTIANNMFIGGDDGLYLDDVEETDIFHNSLVGDDYGIFVNDQANLDIRNNIFYSNGGDIPFYYLDAATVPFTTFDYNIFYTTGANIARSSSGNYADVTALQAGLGGNANSLSGDPVFLNPTSDLHVGGTLANDVGDNTVGITVDIDGDTRPLAPSTTVDIGADEFTPAACAFPSGLITAGVTDTAATFNWTENGTATQWEVEYGVAGFTQGTGTVVVVMTDTFTTVGGLMANTSYDWYVRAICTNSNSLWSASSNFSTLCGPFATPFVEDWESTSNACWIQSTTDQRDWTFDQNGTGSTGTGPSGDNTPGLAGGGTYIYLETSGVALGQTADIQTSVDLSGLTNPSLKFDYHMWGSTMGTLNIDIEFPVGSGTYTNVWTLSGDQGNMWISSTIGLSAYANQTVGVRIQGISGGSFTSDMAVDNLSFEEAPSCFDVTSLATDSISSTAAKVTWNENGTATQWEVEWDLAGYTAGTSPNSMIVNVDTFTVITGLMANTNYDYYVRAICGAMDTSAWVGSSFFTGYCTPAPVSTDGNGIVGIAFDTVNNVTGLEPGGYGDYTGISGDISRDSTIALDITYATGFTYVTEVWIDWNDDLDFDDAGENVYSGVSQATNPTTLNASFVVPTNAPLGQHRMRVGGADTGPPTPCYTGPWASYEDYTVNVVAPALAPISLPITWDNGSTVDLTTIDFGGNTSTLVADPTNAANTVLQSIKGAGAQVWGGTTFGDSLATPIAFATGMTTIRVVVYSPTSGTPVRLKVEDAANPAISVETEVVTTVANAWDTLSFNFSNNAAGTGAINFANTYNKMSIFYNFGTSPASAETYYADLVEDVSMNPTPPVPAKAPIALPITWDDTANVDYSVIDFGGNGSMLTADPLNASNLVLQSIKGANAQTWGGTTFGDSLSAAISFSAGNTTIRAVVYSPTVGTPVRLKVEDYDNPAISVETEVLTTVANAWDTLNFDMSSQVTGTAAINFANTYDKMSIFYNFGTSPTSAETYYVDYVEFGNPPPAGNTIPYFQNFEAFTNGSPSDEGWSNSATGNPQWLVDAGGTPSAGTGPVVDHTVGTSTGKYVFLETSVPGVAGDRDTLLSAPISVNASQSVIELSFWYHFHGATVGSLEAYIIDAAGTYTLLGSVVGQQQPNQTDPWLSSKFVAAGYQGQTVQIAFLGIRGNGFTGDIAIDDVRLDLPPAAEIGITDILRPSSGCGLGADSVEVEITNFGSASQTGFNVGYSLNGVAITPETVSATLGAGMTMNYTFSATAGLATANNYNIVTYTLLAGDADATNDTLGTTVNSFATVSTFPYSTSFETGNDSWFATGDASWELGTPAGFVIDTAADGTQAWVTDLDAVYGDGLNAFLTSPCFDFTGVANPAINLDIWYDIESRWDGAFMQATTDGGATWNTIGSEDDIINWYNDTSRVAVDNGYSAFGDSWTGDGSLSGVNGTNGWITASHELDGLGGQPSVQLRIVFSSDANTNGDGMGVDNIAIYDRDPLYPIALLNTEDATTGVADSLNVDAWTIGTVVGIDLDGNNGISFTIIDDESGTQEGMNIFNFNDVSGYVVTEGDEILVHGGIIQFRGLTELSPDSILVLSTGNAIPTPIVVTDLDESTESRWLSIPTNWVSLSTSGAFSSNIDLTNGIDTITMRIDSDTDINDSLTASGMPIVPGDTICGLFGIGGQFASSTSAPFLDGYQIFPMRWSDLTICRLSTGINDVELETSEFKLVPNPTNGLFEIRSTGFNNATINVSIRDISGRLISSEIVNNANGNFTKSFDLNEESAGIYFITIVDGESVINEKLILK